MSGIVDMIQTIPNLRHSQPCSREQLEAAQEELGLVFPPEYVEYVTTYGDIRFYATEWTGLNVKGYLNTVETTKEERELNEDFPKGFFVIENLGIDGKLAVVNESGEVFVLQYERMTPLCGSLTSYLRFCMARNDEEEAADNKPGAEKKPGADSDTAEGVPLPPPEPDDRLAALQKTVDGLRQMFEDKIAEDAHKNALFDNMHRELTRYQNGVMDKIVETMALDVIQLTDDVQKKCRIYEKKEPVEENYARLLKALKGVAEDLQDILYRQGIESYRVEGHQVDVRRQKILQTVETDNPDRDNLVAARMADGYEKDGKVLRPERIKIFKFKGKKPEA